MNRHRKGVGLGVALLVAGAAMLGAMTREPESTAIAAETAGSTTSPKEGDVVFSEFDSASGVGALLLAGVNGGGATQIVSRDGFVFFRVAASPDGRSVATVAGPTGEDLALWRVDVASGEMEKIADPDGAKVTSVAWSPDGSRVAYAQWSSDAGTSVFVTAIDGSDPVRVGPPDGFRVSGSESCGPDMLVWTEVNEFSPDGTEIALSSAALCAERNLGDVIVASSDGTSFVNLTAGEREERSPRWSPDGSLLAYETSDGAATRPADGSGAEELLGGGLSPEWHPERDEITVVQPTDPEDADSYDLSTKDRKTKSLTKSVDAPERADIPQWSPDGSFLIFVGVGETSELYRANDIDKKAKAISEPGGAQVLDFDFITKGA